MSTMEKRDAVIIGAGLAGLTAGVLLDKAQRSVAVIDSAIRPGGVIRSEWKDGFLLEYGPTTVMATPDLMDLIDDLGLKQDMLIADAKIPRYVRLGSRLLPVPLSPPSLLSTPLLGGRAKIRLFTEFFRSHQQHSPDETLSSFVSRRFGNDVLENILKPFVSGIWAGDADQLSARAAMPRLVELEEKYGSVTAAFFRERKKRDARVPRGLVSFKNGWETLTQKLSARLTGKISLDTKILRLSRSHETERWVVETDRGAFESGNVFLAAPAHALSPLIHPISDDTALALKLISYAPVAVIHAAVARTDIKHPLNGFGYLIAPAENTPVLGCLWNSSIFKNRAPAEHALFTFFIGGARWPKIPAKSDTELIQLVKEEMKTALDFFGETNVLSVMRAERAIPQYNLGHIERVKVLREMENRHPGLHFIGNYLEGISVGDVIKYSTLKTKSQPALSPVTPALQ
jgi:oxygen-dependent protoporphyrinogen oxidase